jgi:hypothetical protein
MLFTKVALVTCIFYIVLNIVLELTLSFVA